MDYKLFVLRREFTFATVSFLFLKLHVSRNIMVAEPTLFLSADDSIQVRAHITRRGLRVYCIRDFILMVTNQPMSYSEATMYWLAAACSRELRSEHEVQDQYPHTFIGAYEPRHMCITAGGLLLLFMHMQREGLVKERYTEEIKKRLTDLSGGGGAEYVRDHDDGEVDEMMAAKHALNSQGKGLDCPPDDWPFFHGDKETDQRSLQVQPILPALAEEGVKGTNAVIQSDAGRKACKLDKRTAFCIKDLVRELQLDIDEPGMPAFCRTVCTQFRRLHPGADMFGRQRQTYFYLHDKAIMEQLVNEEYAKHMLKKAEIEFGLRANDQQY